MHTHTHIFSLSPTLCAFIYCTCRNQQPLLSCLACWQRLSHTQRLWLNPNVRPPDLWTDPSQTSVIRTVTCSPSSHQVCEGAGLWGDDRRDFRLPSWHCNGTDVTATRNLWKIWAGSAALHSSSSIGMHYRIVPLHELLNTAKPSHHT